MQVLSLSAEEREAAEKEAAEAKAAALAASSNPEQIPSNGPVQPEVHLSALSLLLAAS